MTFLWRIHRCRISLQGDRARESGLAYKYTGKGNQVAVISNGTAVLGLGDIGALAGKPVMEGKSLLFKIFAGIDSFDIEIDEKDPDKLVEIVKAISPYIRWYQPLRTSRHRNVSGLKSVLKRV